MLGGRTLGGIDYLKGLAVAKRADADGDANEVKFVPAHLPELRSRYQDLRRFVAECNSPTLCKRPTSRATTTPHALPQKVEVLRRYVAAVAGGVHALGRECPEDWGWMRGPQDKRRRGRCLTRKRPGEDVTRELTACTVVCDGEQMVQRMDLPGPAKEVQARLKQWLRGVWSDRWLKDRTHKRRPHSVVPRLGYTCRFIVFSGKPSRNARSPARHDVYSSGDLRPRVKKAKGACV